MKFYEFLIRLVRVRVRVRVRVSITTLSGYRKPSNTLLGDFLSFITQSMFSTQSSSVTRNIRYSIAAPSTHPATTVSILSAFETTTPPPHSIS